MMRKILSSTVLALALCVPPAHAANPRSEAKAQVEFGIDVAQKGLWQEAIFRWEKAAEIDPTYAAAFNNLAMAYEHEGLVREGAQSLRHGDRARPEERLDPTELRALQGNQ